MDAFPRALIISPNAFNHVSGGGVTFSNLFQGWPSDRLATIHNDPEPVSDDICSRYYFLDRDEIDLIFPFNHLRQASRRTTQKPPAEGHGTPSTGKDSLIRRAALSVLGDRLPERARLTPTLENWIAEFKPDFVYTVLGTGGVMDLIEAVRSRFDLPLVVHVMDDWMNTTGKGLLGCHELRRTRQQAEQFFKIADLRLSISPAMCEAYDRRYGVPFQAFQNTIDVSKWVSTARQGNEVGQPADILYIGSIFSVAQSSSLIDACHAVAELNDQGKEVTLTIASPAVQAARYRDRLMVHPNIKIVGTIADDQAFFQRISAADVLLLPVNFDEETRTFIRYSMPTKVPAYLTSGTPILAYGPSGVAQIDYAKQGDWALIVDQPGVESLATGIRRLLEDDSLRQHLSRNAMKCAAQNHDSAVVRRDFQSALCSVVRKYQRKAIP